MVQTKTIAELKLRKKAKIIGFSSEEIPVKMYEIGLLPGVEIEVKSKLPFAGPLTVQINGNQGLIALRNAEAKTILIEQI